MSTSVFMLVRIHIDGGKNFSMVSMSVLLILVLILQKKGCNKLDWVCRSEEKIKGINTKKQCVCVCVCLAGQAPRWV